MLQKSRYKMGAVSVTILLFLSALLCIAEAKEFEDVSAKIRDDFASERFNDGIKAIASDPGAKTATSEPNFKKIPAEGAWKIGSGTNRRPKTEDEDEFDDVEGYGSDSEDVMKDTEQPKTKSENDQENYRKRIFEEVSREAKGNGGKLIAEDVVMLRNDPEDGIKIVPKDGRFFAVDNSQTSSGESGRNSKIKGGVPFFIADDGKSIQLPQSDVIYNTETGDIVIRNRNTERPRSNPDIEAKSSNVRIESSGAQNTQDDSIAEKDDTIKKPQVFNVPIIESSKPIDMSTPRNTLKDRSEADSGINSSISETKNDMNNVMEDRKKDVNYTSLEDDQNEDIPELDHSLNANEETTVNPFDIGKVIFNDKVRNGKKSVDISEEEIKFALKDTQGDKFDDNESKATTKLNNDSSKIDDDEPVYKFPITTEKIKTVKETQRSEDGFNDSYKPEEMLPRTISGTPSRSRPDEGYLMTSVMPESTVSQPDNPGMMHKNTIDKNHDEDFEEGPANFIAMPGKVDSVLDKNLVKKIPVKDTFVPVKKEVRVLNKEEVLDALRGYLEDAYLRPPIAIVVDTEVGNLQGAGKAWEDMEKRGGDLNVGDIVLLGYDQDGITWMSHHRSSNQQQGPEARSFKKALVSIKPTSKRLLSSDPAAPLTRAARLLPYDSAVFIFSSGSSPVPPPRLIKLLLSKRIKLYSISSSSLWAPEAAEASGGASVSLNPSLAIQNQKDVNVQSQNQYNEQLFASEIIDQEKQRKQQIFHGQIPDDQHNLYQERLDHGSLRELRETSYEHPHLRGLRALTATSEDIDEEEELDFDEEQTLLLRSNLTGVQTLPIPIDSSIRTLIIMVTKKPKLAVIHGPRGIKVDLLESLASNEGDPDGLIYRIPMAKERPDEEEAMVDSEPFQGIWKLTVKINGSDIYDVRIQADTSVRVMAKLVRKTHGAADSKNLKIAVGGTVASVREAVMIDRTGAELGKLNYRYRYSESNEAATDVSEVETLRAMESGTVVREASIPEDMVEGTAFRVRISGRNDRDEPFVRLSKELIAPPAPKADTSGKSAKLEDQTLGRGLGDIEAEKGVNFNLTKQSQVTTAEGLPMTALQIGSASRLYGTPGAQMQINFEVTNNRDNPVYFRFGAKDDQYFLRTMNPQRQWINGGQTVNVVVTIGITSTAENGVRDTVIFTANGLDQTQLSAHVYVETDGRISQDRSRPYLRHDYRGDCMGYLDSTSCAKKTWGLDITARDTESGLLRINTSPGVIIYDSGFKAGAREEVRARYTATCCETRVLLSATDLNGNVATDEINVALYFTPITIAAIVLGVLLFIALIVAVVFLIRFCLRKRRDSRDLPSYQTQRVTRTP